MRATKHSTIEGGIVLSGIREFPGFEGTLLILPEKGLGIRFTESIMTEVMQAINGLQSLRDSVEEGEPIYEDESVQCPFESSCEHSEGSKEEIKKGKQGKERKDKTFVIVRKEDSRFLSIEMMSPLQDRPPICKQGYTKQEHLALKFKTREDAESYLCNELRAIADEHEIDEIK